MKKRILSLVLTTLMVVSTLVGCGGNTNQDETNKPNTETEVNTEMDSETEISTETKKKITCNKCGWYTDSFETDFCHGCGNRDLTITENGTETEVGDSEVDVENFFKDAYSLEFPTGMTGFTDKYVFSSDETWSLNDTHYVDVDGNVMDFEWEGPTELGEKASVYANTLTLSGGNYLMEIWYGGTMTLEDITPCLEATKDVWITAIDSSYTIPEDGYYKNEQIGNVVMITYEVIDTINSKHGFVRLVNDADNGVAYNFMYLENENVYDTTRAMKVVESIKYWDYEPTNE